MNQKKKFMKHIKTLLIIAILLSQTLFAQVKLPIIKATSKSVDVRDGNTFRKNAWNISPEIKPDIYTTPFKHVNVTFYTDIDSISFLVETDKKYDFMVLLNGKDTAYTQIKYEPSYLEKLKIAYKYDFTDTRVTPKFTYQSMNDTNLVVLRKRYKLDSIAGMGNETLKIINLMHWVHNLIPHDGQHENTTVKNALSMIPECSRDKRGLNCRGLAIVLNECYLAMGFKSRYVTCMPKDSVFEDCHVINMVYSNMLNKWIWMDPTNNAYVMNENGELLSIEEVRANLIGDKPLILNPDANWNNSSSITKAWYLYSYMAKNLYRMECPLNSIFDNETWKKDKVVSFMELVPLDAYLQNPQKEEHTNAKTGTTFINYKTNNPATFWAKPE